MPAMFRRKWSKAVFLGLVLHVVHAGFNCNRPGSKCVHGSCDYTNECSCYRGYTGFMCDYETSKVVTCPKDKQCKTGKCTSSSGGTLCHCDYDFYGPACNKPRYTLDCFYDRMALGLNPVNFQGHVRYIDKLTSSACDFKPIADLKAAGDTAFKDLDWEGWGAVATHKGDACNGDATYSTTHGFDIYTRKVVVQYYDRVYVSLDEIVTFICAVEKHNPVNVMKSVFTAPLEDGFLDKASVRGVGTHFVFSLHKSNDDSAITDGDTLGVGALVFLKVKIREHSPYATLIIESCSADAGEGNNQTTYTFHEQGCPVEPVGQWIMKPNAKEFQLYFKIFRFEETNQLRITCVVRGCTSWDSPSCSISQCSHVDRKKREALPRADELLGFRRKGNSRQIRAAAKPDNLVLPSQKDGPDVKKLNDSEVIRLTVVITDKKNEKNPAGSIVVREVSAPNFQACTLSFEFWVVMISMTVVIVALTATTISYILKRRKLRNRKKKKGERAMKKALNNIKSMQMSTFPWSFPYRN